jgi:hypothetical protein
MWQKIIGGALVALCGIACGNSGSEATGYDYRSKGALLYEELCAVCHGEAGQGGLGLALVDGTYELSSLRNRIDATMPKGDSARCTDDCADAVANFIVEGLQSEELACRGVPPGLRRLRLLTRREYRNTARDLIDGLSPQSCGGPDDCGFRQRCLADQCLQESCDQHSFVYDAGGRELTSVHVAGTFNEWAPTRAAGGLELQRNSGGLWIGRFPIAGGNHSYKLVLNESEWISDARAAESSPDGFGGSNSALALSCDGSQGFDPALAFPAEVRPDGFAFESFAASGYVSSVHVDAHLAAAEGIADELAGRMLEESSCARDAACATDFVNRVGPRAFRRPLREDEVQALVALVQDADSFEEGLETASTALLISPSFLYRSELGEARGGGVFRLTPHEMASALSYTFWGTMPDDELWALAQSGEIDSAEVFEAQARRLLDDSRSNSAMETFAAQWLGAESILSVDKKSELFPDFDEALRDRAVDSSRSSLPPTTASGPKGWRSTTVSQLQRRES